MRIIKYSDFIKRKIALESSIDIISEKNCKFYRDRAMHSLKSEDIIKFMEECNTSTLIEVYLSDIKYFVESIEDRNILRVFENNILPNLKSNVVFKFKNASRENIEKINEQLEVNRVCNRILSNHEKCIKRGINNFINESDFIIINKCCDCVSETTLPIYGKICTALEEAKYIFESSARDYNPSKMISSVVDYFTIKDGIIGESNKIIESLKNNIYLSDDTKIYLSECNNIPYFIRTIEIFKLSPNKNPNFLKETLDSILKVENYQIKNALSAFFDLLKELLISSTDEELCTSIYQEIIPAIYETIFNDKLDNPEIKNIVLDLLSLIDNELNISNVYINRYNDSNVSNHMLHYNEAIKELSNKLSEVNNLIYTQYNIECMNKILSESSDNLISIEEFKLFKFQNLINMSKNIDKYFKDKLSGTRNKVSKVFKKIRSKIFEETSICDTVTENGLVDFIVCAIESDINSDTQVEISEYCKAINNSILFNSDYKCYYTTNESSFDIHIRDNCTVNITEDFLKEINEYFTIEDKFNIEKVLEFSNYDISFNKNKIIDFFSESTNNDLFKDFVEVCSLANIDKEIVEEIHEEIMDNKAYFSEGRYIDFYHGTSSFVLLYETAKSPVEIQIEAMQLLSLFSESKYEEDDEEKDPSFKEKRHVNKDIKTAKKVEKKESKEKEKDGEDKFSGLKLNNIKLYLQGLKKKMKDMSAKEQEISRQADTTFNNFAKACKNALISDRREAIIKGSVIPSFSKSVKIGVAMAGLYIVNPLAAVITAFGGLAMSKNLTKKERALLLDELEVELEMIEKEIQNAESKNQLKKERALMMQKKQLQRQYQRIKYNIRIGKDLIPGSSVGVGNKE